MNSCMRQSGSINPMRNNFMQGMDYSETESKMDCQKEDNYNNDIDSFPIAMAYVPWQKWRDVVDGCRGLKQATIFNELVLNFECANKCCGSSNIPRNLPYGQRMSDSTDENCGCARRW